jgi:Fe-Mn family superoxide dismutase
MDPAVAPTAVEEETQCEFELPPLPYPKDALEPHLGAETLEYHYEKHHRGYLKKLQQAIANTPLAGEDAGRDQSPTTDGPVFNNAPRCGTTTSTGAACRRVAAAIPPASLRGDLDRAFGSLDAFKKKVVDAAVAQFGSGYVWLYSSFDGRLAVRATHDAMNPLLDGVMPLFTIDLWEHSYYLKLSQRAGALREGGAWTT